jgi:prepilin-type N-terminal cleavage/methylation domain-containing protein
MITYTKPRRAPQEAGFSLIEMMAVVFVLLLLVGFLAPAMISLKSAGDLTKSANEVAGALEQARNYAMANKTFVWVGIREVDISKDPSASPQTSGAGRLAIATVASKDGIRGYDVTNSSLPLPAWTSYNNGAGLLPVGKLQHLENIHLATTLNGFGKQPPTSGNMARPYIQSNYYVIGTSESGTCVTPFDWPLGSALAGGQYSFQSVVNFDPQGVARIQYSTNNDFIGTYIEVGLQQTHGTVVSSSPNVVAVQINCVTGAIRVYRP